MDEKQKASVTLLFLSPMIAELLSGSAPPVEFFNPIGLLFLVLLYGCGAVLIRETVKRWRKGAPSLLLLGGAYGIWEEGVVVKSFFDPNWVDLGILGTYGRRIGVNWVWVLHLTIYHVVMSITVPIILVETMYEHVRDTTWLGKRGITLLSILFLIDSLLINLLITRFQPSIWQYAFCFLLIVILIWLARKVPRSIMLGKHELPSYRKLWFIGFLWISSFFFSILGITVHHTLSDNYMPHRNTPCVYLYLLLI